jgi:hypothetical protein
MVLGNTGSFKIFPGLKSIIEGNFASQKIKLEAISSLRLIDHPDINPYLDKLASGKKTELRDKAMEVMKFRKEQMDE